MIFIIIYYYYFLLLYIFTINNYIESKLIAAFMWLLFIFVECLTSISVIIF